MAAFPRCLCVILTLWMVSSRPSASILPGASASGAWWGTPESKKFAKQADSARRAGDLSTAESFYKQGYEDALRRGDEHAQVGYLNGIAACQLTELHFRRALETLLEAKRHAKAIVDWGALGAIAVNLSSVYLQVWDFDSALREAEEGRPAAAHLQHPYFLPNLLIELGYCHEMHRDGLAESLYRQGIQAARVSNDRPLAALGLDLLGAELLRQGRLDEAGTAIEDGMRLREKVSPKDLGYSWRWMGALKLAHRELAEASDYTERALHAERRAPEYLLKHQRGEIRMAAGDRQGALADFGEAVDLACQWRLEVLPAKSTLTAANEELERQVFTSFIDAAALEALRTGDPHWAGRAFEAVELNRAASLRESLALSDAWHRKLPPEYWETLQRLRTVDSQALANAFTQKKLLEKIAPTDQSRRLRLELAEMEAKAGLGFPAKNSEIFRDQTSLIHFRQGLGRTEVLLSFHLGDRESYLWVVTREALQIKKIAAKEELRPGILAFETAVRTGRPEAVELGEELYQKLFGQLGQAVMDKPSWLLSLEGMLFEVPFAALVVERKGDKVNYLVSKHSVQTIPGALLLSKRPEAGTGSFLGVGDPIYNVADPRWEGRKNSTGFFNRFRAVSVATRPEMQFGRLVGSGEELKASAANWGGAALRLEGATARRDLFLAHLADQPAVVHLATHVISQGPQALIAFGLGPAGESEFLTTTDVASLRVPGAVVVMTGCESGIGDELDGAGLQGLTRAWEMAGASAVVATSWSVRDSTGDIFASFYKHLQHASAAEALRLSQVEMLQSGTSRALPSYWAPYRIIGGGR